MKCLIVIELVYGNYNKYASSSNYTEAIHDIISRNSLPSDAYHLGII